MQREIISKFPMENFDLSNFFHSKPSKKIKPESKRISISIREWVVRESSSFLLDENTRVLLSTRKEKEVDKERKKFSMYS
jgi:hypothetical protein